MAVATAKFLNTTRLGLRSALTSPAELGDAALLVLDSFWSRSTRGGFESQPIAAVVSITSRFATKLPTTHALPDGAPPEPTGGA